MTGDARMRQGKVNQSGTTDVGAADEGGPPAIKTDIPARMDRLPWVRWHWIVLIGLGTVWILDGLEVTIVGSLGDRLTEKSSGLHINAGQIGVAASLYVAGAVVGALFFGYLTDRLGRKRLFMWTLLLYLAATILTAFSMIPLWFYACRFFTGAGIGGEYAAINSAIDELIPARVRGTVDLIVNGSYWLGAAAGAALTLVLLDKSLFAPDLGWRLAFGLGAILGLAILLVRRAVPESPRWLFIHNQKDRAEELVDSIEERVAREADDELEQVSETIEIHPRKTIGFGEIARTMLRDYRRRSILGLSLFIGQAFLYNAVFFTQGLVLGQFFKVDGSIVGLYIVPLALGNFLGPLLLGRFFDTVGRRVMVTMSYVVSGILLVGTGVLFQLDALSATTLTICWSAVFFFASAGASAAYLTVSEIFPMETRAMAIAFFYALGTGLGGIIGPVLFGHLVETNDVNLVALGYYIGAALMIAAGLVEAAIGVSAEQKSLEEVADPLTATSHSDESEVSPATAGAQDARPGRPTGRPKQKAPSLVRQGQAWAPVMAYSTRPPGDPYLDREVDMIVASVEETPRHRAALRTALHANRWGPGRFNRALLVARRRGLVRSTRGGAYERVG